MYFTNKLGLTDTKQKVITNKLTLTTSKFYNNLLTLGPTSLELVIPHAQTYFVQMV